MATSNIKWGDGSSIVATSGFMFAQSEYRGMRFMIPYINQGTWGPHLMNSRGADSDTDTNPDFDGGSWGPDIGRYLLGSPANNGGNGDSTSFMVCGIDKFHGTPGTDSLNAVFFGEFAGSDYIEMILRLPYFRDTEEGGFGNTPDSTTDRDVLTLQIYNAGMWILRGGMVPPIDVDCILNYTFDFDDSWDGGTNIYDWRGGFSQGSGEDGTLSGTNLGTSFAANGCLYVGIMPFSGSQYINVNNGLSLSGNQVSYEWVGKQYVSSGAGGAGDAGTIFDASDSAQGVKCETNLANGDYGIAYRWGEMDVVNGSTIGSQYGFPRGWRMFTGNSDTDVSKFYFKNNYLFDSNLTTTITSTCNSAMVHLEDNFKIGARENGSDGYEGWLAYFRIWDGELTENQAKICSLHERGRVAIQSF